MPPINILMSAELILLTNVDSPIWQRSIGAYQVANHCRQNGISCQVIDFTSLFKEDELLEIISKCIDKDTLAIGVSTTFYSNKYARKKFVGAERAENLAISDETRSILYKLKTANPNLKTIAGGSNSYKLEGDSQFDAVFHGYSEQSVVEYLQELKGQRNRHLRPKVGTTEIVDGASSHFDITSLSHIWDDTDCVLDNETLPIEVSRGCIFKCTFCSYPLNGKKKFDYLRDPQLIKEELISNYERFGTTNYFFADDTFNDSTLKLESLHKVITELPFKIKFVTYLRLDLLYAHPEQITLLKEMGLGSAFFGIETFNHASGKLIGKGMKPDLVKQFLLDLYYKHWNEEIAFTCSFIIGLPGESKESIRESHNWFRSTPFNDLWFPLLIKEDSHYKSDFDVNYKKYGYTLDDQGGWTNDVMTYLEAMKLAEEFNVDGAYGNNSISTWVMFGLLSYGFNIAELRKQKANDIHWPVVIVRKMLMFRKYKEKLIQAIQR